MCDCLSPHATKDCKRFQETTLLCNSELETCNVVLRADHMPAKTSVRLPLQKMNTSASLSPSL